MKKFPLSILLGTGVPGLVSGIAMAADAPTAAQDAELDTVLITAQRDDRVSSGATGLDLDIKDTPQSISVVTQEQMELFGIDDVNGALRLATGIDVEEWETNRTNYLSRGFEIENTQIDGVGLPNGWGIVTGAMDAFGYEKLEVIRGANGLLTGVGNSSGTINYVRKRPTNTAQGSVGVTFGSWNDRRIEADYSTPFTADGAWAGRLVVAREDSDSYLRDLDNDRTYVYGVIDGQIGERSTLALGYSWQKADTTGNMWGALTLSNQDGSQTGFGRDSSTTQDWTYWNTWNHGGFAEYTYALSSDWQLKLSYNYRRSKEDDQLFFAYTVTGLDPQTREGLLGWAFKGNDTVTSHLGDLSVSGHFDLFGRTHEAMLGASLARSKQPSYYYPVDPSDPAFGELPAFPYAGNAVAEPPWGERTLDNTLDQKLRRVYGAARLALTDRLKAIVGFNYAHFSRDGIASGTGEPFAQGESKTSPYAGLTFDFTGNLLGYVSYSDIYKPQDQYGADGRYLDPTKGVNYEVGVKADWLDKRLLTTLAWFDAKQKNLATFAGYLENGNYYYNGLDVESKGVEFEATGRLNRHVDLVLGYTGLKLTDEDGNRTYEWVPRHMANLTLATRVPGYTALSLGVGGQYRSRAVGSDSYTGYRVRQGGYAVLNAFAAWKFLPQATLRANVNNVGDRKYIGSLYQIGYYGAPRNYSVSVDWKF